MDENLRLFFDLLIQWNRRINLTAVKDIEGFRNKHVKDSLSLLPFLGDAKKIVDLGAGAGIPGIIIKIAQPDIDVTLVDATRKKISFCEEAIRKLGLQGIRAIWGRAEDPSLARSVGRFDVVVSRATWKLAEFLKIAHSFAANDGIIIAMKGPKWRRELEAAAKMALEGALVLEGTHPYKLPDGEERCLLVFKR